MKKKCLRVFVATPLLAISLSAQSFGGARLVQSAEFRAGSRRPARERTRARGTHDRCCYARGSEQLSSRKSRPLFCRRGFRVIGEVIGER